MSAALCACGVVAVGRCVTCRSAYCMSHGDRYYVGAVPIIEPNQCAVCGTKNRADIKARKEAKAAAHQRELEEVKQRVIQRAAELVERGYPLPTVRKDRSLPSSQQLAPAWLVGTYMWRQNIARGEPGTCVSHPTGVTPNGDIVPMDSCTQSEAPGAPWRMYKPSSLYRFYLSDYDQIVKALEGHLAAEPALEVAEANSPSRWKRLKKLMWDPPG